MVNFFDEDDDVIPDDLGWGPVIVRRPVYDQGMKLLEAAGPDDGPAFETARGVAQDFELAGKADEAAHWYAVGKFLEWRAAVAADAETVVLEEGEEWDRDRRKKVKSRKKTKSTKKVKSEKNVKSKKKAKSRKKVRAGKNRPRSGRRS
jgi:hypothetical protein